MNALIAAAALPLASGAWPGFESSDLGDSQISHVQAAVQEVATTDSLEAAESALRNAERIVAAMTEEQRAHLIKYVGDAYPEVRGTVLVRNRTIGTTAIVYGLMLAIGAGVVIRDSRSKTPSFEDFTWWTLIVWGAIIGFFSAVIAACFMSWAEGRIDSGKTRAAYDVAFLEQQVLRVLESDTLTDEVIQAIPESQVDFHRFLKVIDTLEEDSE